jgi:hypothetical protein
MPPSNAAHPAGLAPAPFALPFARPAGVRPGLAPQLLAPAGAVGGKSMAAGNAPAGAAGGAGPQVGWLACQAPAARPEPGAQAVWGCPGLRVGGPEAHAVLGVPHERVEPPAHAWGRDPAGAGGSVPGGGWPALRAPARPRCGVSPLGREGAWRVPDHHGVPPLRLGKRRGGSGPLAAGSGAPAQPGRSDRLTIAPPRTAQSLASP